MEIRVAGSRDGGIAIGLDDPGNTPVPTRDARARALSRKRVQHGAGRGPKGALALVSASRPWEAVAAEIERVNPLRDPDRFDALFEELLETVEPPA